MLTVRLPDNVMQALTERAKMRGFKSRSDYVRWLVMQDITSCQSVWTSFLWKLSGVSTVRLERFLKKSTSVSDFMSQLSNASQRLEVVPEFETDTHVSYTFTAKKTGETVTVTIKKLDSLSDTIVAVIETLRAKMMKEVSDDFGRRTETVD